MQLSIYPCIALVVTLLMQIDLTASAVLSWGKTVTSSSVYSDWVPARVIDSNKGNDADQCHCCAATTNELNPWYQLDLGGQYKVHQVVIYGRPDKNFQQHFKNLQIFFESINGTLQNAERTEMTETYEVDFTPRKPKYTRYVSLMLRNVTRVFTVCEMTVYGECQDGQFNYYCSQSCHCDGDPCNKTSGVCPSGNCLPGFYGEKCDTVCQNGRYGPGCDEKCGNCYNTATCNKTTGYCPGKCMLGYQGKRCKRECSNNTFGQDCNSKCGNCLENKPCDAKSGVCKNGCSAGFRTIYCNSECNPGTYGENCKESCGYCKDRQACVITNGTCPTGCQAGYGGDICKTECNDGTFGENCQYKCGYCADGEVCQKKTGYCRRGCQPGYIGDSCNKTCDDGYYGNGCIEKCGQCDSNTVCTKTTGECSAGCMEGFKLLQCKEECEDGKYGKNCAHQCGHCLNNTACDKTNGTCASCDTGYQGHDCMARQTGNSQNRSPMYIIGWVIGVILILVLTVLGVFVFLRYKARSSKLSEKIHNPSLELHRMEDAKPIQKPIETTTGNHFHKETENGQGVNCADTDYYSFISRKRELKICQVWDYINQKKKDECVPFYQEFNLLKAGLLFPHEVALMKENKPKTRYKGLYAYDHSRVLLDAEVGESEYINASFIDGIGKEKKFIASQGPTEAMRDDFWRMVWQQKTQQIVMLTNLVEMGSEKCLIYWPEEKDVTYGNITVRLESQIMQPDFITRNLRVRKNDEDWRRVTQYHFRAWPDKDVPDSTWSLVHFWYAVSKDADNKQGPIVVHCSAGIGRTGTFIALDNGYHQAKAEGTLRLLDIVTALRDQRVNMVQTKEQYVFLHEAIADALLFGTHYIWLNQFEDVYTYLTEEVKGTEMQRIKTQYSLIMESIEDRKKLENDRSSNYNVEYSNVFVPQNKASPTVTPDDYIPKSKSGHNFRDLGAVLLPNREGKNTIIIAKSPTDSTIEAFWSLIDEQHIKTIVMLTTETSPSYKVCANLGTYNPAIQNKFDVSMREVQIIDLFNETVFKYKSNCEYNTVRQFEFKTWRDMADTPDDRKSMLNFLKAVLNSQERMASSQPVLVHCSNGFERSGLVCVLLSELERMRQDQGHINIVESVKLMKERNENIIPNFKQYMYIYDTILSMFPTDEMYANCRDYPGPGLV